MEQEGRKARADRTKCTQMKMALRGSAEPGDRMRDYISRAAFDGIVAISPGPRFDESGVEYSNPRSKPGAMFALGSKMRNRRTRRVIPALLQIQVPRQRLAADVRIGDSVN